MADLSICGRMTARGRIPLIQGPVCFVQKRVGPLIASTEATAKVQMGELEHKKTVLLVDDDTTLLESVRGFLAGDYEVLSATSGQEALQKAKTCKSEIHLLLSDF